VVWWQYRSDPFLTTYVADALSYHRWAERIVREGLAAEPVFHQSPLFPLVLAGVYAGAAEHLRAIWSIGLQALLSSVAIALLVPVGRVWFGRTSVGVAAAVLALLHGPFVFYAMKLLPTALALTTQALGLLLLALARRSRSAAPAAAAGAAWGLACLARSEMLLFVPFLLLAVAQRGSAEYGPRRRRWASAGVCLAALVIVIAPVTVHNVRRGDLVPIASSAGENLFIGNQPGAEGGYRALHPSAGDIFSQRVVAQRIAEQERGRPLRPSEVSAYWRARTFREIRADPGNWLALEGRKLLRILHPGDPTDLYSFSLERNLYLPALHALAVPPWVLLALGITGAALAIRGAARSAWPLLALVGVHVVVLLAFFVDARLRLPLLFSLCPFAGLALVEAVRRWRAGTSRVLLTIGGVAVVALLVAGVAATRPTPRDAVRIASVLSMQERLDESLEVLAPWLAEEDAHAWVLDQAGWVHQKRGDLVEARDLYVRALDRGLAGGRACQARTRLAMVHERLGEFAEAARQHDAAIASGHANAGTFYERGRFRLRRGDRDGAVADLRRAARLDPAWPAPRRALRSAGAS
jgi:tetratricopeptide (TPR) repeat protein